MFQYCLNLLKRGARVESNFKKARVFSSRNVSFETKSFPFCRREINASSAFFEELKREKDLLRSSLNS